MLSVHYLPILRFLLPHQISDFRVRDQDRTLQTASGCIPFWLLWLSNYFSRSFCKVTCMTPKIFLGQSFSFTFQRMLGHHTLSDTPYILKRSLTVHLPCAKLTTCCSSTIASSVDLSGRNPYGLDKERGWLFAMPSKHLAIALSWIFSITDSNGIGPYDLRSTSFLSSLLSSTLMFSYVVYEKLSALGISWGVLSCQTGHASLITFTSIRACPGALYLNCLLFQWLPELWRAMR